MFSYKADVVEGLSDIIHHGNTKQRDKTWDEDTHESVNKAKTSGGFFINAIKDTIIG